MTPKGLDLKGMPVMLSASLPPSLEGTARSQDAFDVIVSIVGGVLAAGGSIIFGGHPSITPLVHRVAQSGGPGTSNPRIALFQLARFRKQAPPEVEDPRVFKEVSWFGSPDATGPESLAEDLGKMRQAMVDRAEAAIFAGGKREGFLGNVPGVRDEYQRFTEHHPEGPVYLVGLLGGEAGKIIHELEHAGQREVNSLNDVELDLLHHTDSVDLASSLILADLQRTSAA